MPLRHNGCLHRHPFFNYISGVTYVNSLDSVLYSGNQFVPETKTVILECVSKMQTLCSTLARATPFELSLLCRSRVAIGQVASLGMAFDIV